MGRKAGVAADETRTTLLNAAAKVFAYRGYDGASIAEITSEAGLTSGAVYAHYASKAELFIATLRAHMEKDLDRLLGTTGSPRFLDALASIGGTFDQREPTEESLVVAAIVATRTHPDVAALLVQLVTERQRVFESLVRESQDAGILAADVSARSLARLSLMIALGSLLAGALALEPLDHADWERLMGRLVGTFKP